MRGGVGMEGREGIEGGGGEEAHYFFCSLFVCFFENKWFVICDVCFFLLRVILNLPMVGRAN